jgi:alpha-glucosidase
MLAHYRAVLAARKASSALQLGRLELLDSPDPLLAFRRTHGGDERIVAVSFGAPAELDLEGQVVVASAGEAGQPFSGRLGADEAVIVRPVER